jgi:hypothetical protein
MSAPSEGPDTDLYLMVGEIKSDVKAILAQNAAYEKRISDVEKRTFKVERKIWTGAGAAAMLSMFVTAAVAKVFGLSFT